MARAERDAAPTITTNAATRRGAVLRVKAGSAQPLRAIGGGSWRWACAACLAKAAAGRPVVREMALELPTSLAPAFVGGDPSRLQPFSFLHGQINVIGRYLSTVDPCQNLGRTRV